MSVERVNPPSLVKPSGFSHAVVASGGSVIFLAGQTATDQAGSIVGSTVTGQFEQALSNLLVALAAAGGTPDQLASLTVYVTDLDDYRASSQQIGAVWRRLAGPDYPAMAAVQVGRLWDTAALVEIQGYAVVGAG